VRRRRAEKREIQPDPVYNNFYVGKLINRLMVDGKKARAKTIVYKAIDGLAEKTGKPPMEAFRQALENVKPLLEVRPRRVGGATYQIPFEVPEERALSLALRWILNASRNKKGRPMSERLMMELVDAYNGSGAAFKRKEEVHRMAEAGKAYSHFRW
jgi:small subunit ribosomal protein S7